MATTHRFSLVLTDFDGTIYRYGKDAHMYPAFAAVLADLRRQGARWVVCTGRPLYSIRRATRQMVQAGVHPDVIVAGNVWVHVCHNGCWHFLPTVSWRIVWRIRQRKAELAERLRAILHAAHKSFAACRVTEIAAHQFRLQFHNAGDAQRALEILSPAARADPAIRMVQSERDIELQCVPCSKAVAARTVAEHLRVLPQQTMAIGDGHSDLGMLGRDVAHLTGCPLNASRETVQTVMEAGGHVSALEALAGTLDVIDAWRRGTVSSAPPATWQPPQGLLAAGGRPADIHRNRFLIGTEVAMIVSAVLLSLLVLTKYGVIRLPEFLARPFIRAGIIDGGT